MALNGATPYVCAHCGIRVYGVDAMNLHLQIHRQEKYQQIRELNDWMRNRDRRRGRQLISFLFVCSFN